MNRVETFNLLAGKMRDNKLQTSECKNVHETALFRGPRHVMSDLVNTWLHSVALLASYTIDATLSVALTQHGNYI